LITRQAKSKALEALSISNNKRRIETESDLNEDQEDNPKRSHSKHTSSSHHSIRHVSNTVRRKRSEKLSNTKTLKRQRHSSSDDEDNQSSIQTKSKRNSEPQSESTDTGNLCVRRGPG
jgi:hypothetical protein